MLLPLVAAAAPGFQAAVERVAPAVVSIVTERIPLAAALDSGASVPAQRRALGAGFVIDSAGHILTCNHVVAGYEELKVEFPGGRTYSGREVRVVGRDPVTDLAVVRVQPGRQYAPVEFADSDSVEVGQWVVAVGNPFGLENSASAGIVSSVSRWGLAKSSGPDFQDFIQTDALINPGNSGGPLCDEQGRVVGVCSFTKTARGSDFTGIGFATPINQALEIASQLIAQGKVVRGWLGANTQPLTDGLRDALGLETTEGALVSSVALSSPALAAGIEPGDVIVELDGAPVAGVRSFQRDVTARRPGSEVALALVRRQRRVEVRARLGAWPVAGTEPRPVPASTNWLGLAVRELTAAEAAAVPGARGAAVASVDAASAADDAGIRPGDVILQVNFAGIAGPAAFAQAAQTAAGRTGPFLFRMQRGATAFYVAIRP